MHGRSRTFRAAFTLIELLVVIAIIAILVGLLFPAVKRALNSAKRTKAAHEVTQLATAFKAYYDEYHRWPTNMVGYDTDEFATGIEVLAPVVKMLKGESDPASVLRNAKLLPFLDLGQNATNGVGSYLDPWGKPYKYMLDYNQDNILHIEFTGNFEKTNINANVGVWSRGRDQSDRGADITGPDGENGAPDGKSDWEDDIRSW